MKHKISGEQTFTQGAAVLLIATVLVKLIGAFFKIPLSSDYCLGDLGFGYFSSVYDIYIPFFTISSSGFPVAISKIMSEFHSQGREEDFRLSFKIFRSIMLVLGAVGFLVVLVLIKPLSLIMDGSGNISFTLLVMAPAVFFCCISAAYRGAFESYRNMTLPALSNIIEAISKMLLGFVSAFLVVKYTGNLSLGAAAAMAGVTISNLLCFIFLKISYLKLYKKKVDINKVNKSLQLPLMKKLVIVSLPIVFSSLAGSIISLIDSVTVNWQMSGMMAENFSAVLGTVKDSVTKDITADTLPTFLYGIRSKAYTLFNLTPTFISAFTISALPIITSAFTMGDRKSVGQSMNTLIKFSSVIAFPMAFGFVFAGKQVMTILYGDISANAGGSILMIYGFAAMGACISFALTAFLQAIGKQNKAFLNFAVGIVLKLIFNIVLVGIPDINIFGSAISTVICYLYVAVASLVCVLRSGFLLDFKNTIIKPFVSAFACGVTAWLLCRINDSKLIVLVAIFVAALVYFAFLIILKCFEKSDFEDLPFGKKLGRLLKFT